MRDAAGDLINDAVFGAGASLPNQTGAMAPARDRVPVGSRQPPSGALPKHDQASVDYLIQQMASMLRDTAFSAALPAHSKPHYYSTPIDLSSRSNIAGAAFAPTVWTTALRYIVPPARRARFTHYGLNVLDPTYDYGGSLLFRIQVDGVNQYGDLAHFAIQRGSIVLPRRTVINVIEGQMVTFQIRREVLWPGGAQDVDVCLVGYDWQPRQLLDGARASIVYQG